jgi:hypothetical protein
MMGILSDFTRPSNRLEGSRRRGWGIGLSNVSSIEVQGAKEALCGLCRTKHETKHENFVAGFGEKFVEGYSAEGHLPVDVITAAED